MQIVSNGDNETICMKCPILFSGKIRKNILNLLSAELARRVVNVNTKIIVENDKVIGP